MADPIVCVAGATSRAGKTALAESILAAFPPGRPIAVKFTTTEDVFERCPRGTPCTVCDLDVPWRLVEDPAVLNAAGTDTDRLARAGARRVVWAIARRAAAAEAWKAIAPGLDAPAVVEGSSVVAHAEPTLVLFVAHPRLSPERWKPTSAELIRRADLVVINSPAGERREPSDAVRRALRAARGQEEVRVADVTRPLAEWAPELLERLARSPAAGGGLVSARGTRPRRAPRAGRREAPGAELPSETER